jgi:6-phosphogluconolactonase (cycloisomerase 2 family)
MERAMLENDICASRARRLSLMVVAVVAVLTTNTAQTRTSTLAGHTGQGRQTTASGRSVVYSSIGSLLTVWDLDVAAAALTKRTTVTLPGFITEATLHPSKKIIYIAWGRFTNGVQIHSSPHAHGMSAFRIDPATGAPTTHGPAVSLGESPGYISAVATDTSGKYVLASDTDPGRIIVRRVTADGAIGEEVASSDKLDFGIHPHQIRVDPSNETVVLPCRGDTINGQELPGR